ncbi:AAA family ATPase [Geodermatophilus sp. SYSU D00698]
MLEFDPELDFELETAADLMAADLPPVDMVVGEIIPAGLFLVAGDPKVGKSMLLQDLAVSITQGLPAWGHYPVEPGDVLYLGLEGGRRSFRDRMISMHEGRQPSSGLTIAYSSPPLGGGLEEKTERWLRRADDPRMVVIDTYTAVAPETRGVNRHREEYATLAPLAQLATQWPKTLFVAVHHTRKGDGGEDVMQKISGSQGMTAVTDGNAVLSRHVAAGQGLLSIRPRNAEESEFVVQRDPETLRWSVIGTDERSQLSESRQLVLAWLDAHPEGGGPKTIAEATGLTDDAVRQLLMQMKRQMQVASPRRGHYVAVAGVDPKEALPSDVP